MNNYAQDQNGVGDSFVPREDNHLNEVAARARAEENYKTIAREKLGPIRSLIPNRLRQETLVSAHEDALRENTNRYNESVREANRIKSQEEFKRLCSNPEAAKVVYKLFQHPEFGFNRIRTGKSLMEQLALVTRRQITNNIPGIRVVGHGPFESLSSADGGVFGEEYSTSTQPSAFGFQEDDMSRRCITNRGILTPVEVAALTTKGDDVQVHFVAEMQSSVYFDDSYTGWPTSEFDQTILYFDVNTITEGQ